MDSRIYFHQYRRPRNNNPTYVSNNVNTSLTFFNNHNQYQSPIYNQYNQQPINNQHYQLPNNQYNESYNKGDYNNKQMNYSLNKINDNNKNNITNKQRYHTINNINHQILPTDNQPSIRSNSYNRNHSNLSSYGTNSLSLNQNDIYSKQNSKFNIITMQPKQFDISIRQHPKYTLENKDQLYYKRMAQQLQKKKIYDQAYQNRNRNINMINNTSNTVVNMGANDSIAGKYTYGVQKQKQGQKMNNYEQNSNINPQILNRQNKQPSISLGNHKPIKQFTPKLLSHMDELISLS